MGGQVVAMGQIAAEQLSDGTQHLHPCPTVWWSLSKGSDALLGWYLKFSDSSVFCPWMTTLNGSQRLRGPPPVKPGQPLGREQGDPEQDVTRGQEGMRHRAAP